MGGEADGARAPAAAARAMTWADLIALAQFVAGRIGDALPVLLGGAGGAFLVWWLDGRRVAGRERRDLVGALELVCLEIAGNIAMTELWLNPIRPANGFAPIELRWDAWTNHQTTLARNLPRDLVGQVGVGYELARTLMHNVEVARRRGSLVDADLSLARRVRNWQQANLQGLQQFLRERLGIRFTREPVATADLNVRAVPDSRVPERYEREFFDAFDHLLERYVGHLNSARLPHPADSLADLLVNGLLAKLLRLADALLALVRGGQGRESGPTVRTLLTIYVNFRFLATHPRRNEAAAAYVMHAERTLADLKLRVVREDKPGEAFPTMSEEAWERSRKPLDEQHERIRAEGIPVMKKFRPPDAKGRPQDPLEWSWTGMTDKELFDHVGESDGYRFYAFHSNEVHGNVSGVGDIFTELSQGRLDFSNFDDTLVGGSLILAAKYLLLAMTAFDEYHELGQGAALNAISDQFLEVVRRHRTEWRKRHAEAD
ncbi:MAG: DUF5677 domain-containing protein [Chloroflexota bacterium]|nr:DUF5677 domain-containing protein [Chloroflexota bacterium]